MALNLPPGNLPKQSGRFAVLDGWRAISILLVLATHMLPLGPKRFALNFMAGQMGMALFFTLSGFLITHQLDRRKNVAAFLVRRTFRILPLAYLAIFFAAWLNDASATHVLNNLAFLENYRHGFMIGDLTHFWSLCVEMHFYLFVSFLIWVAPARGLMLLPIVWLTFAGVRLALGPTGAIETHLRVDEILSGCMLALAHLGKLGEWPRKIMTRTPFALLVALLCVTSYEVEWRVQVLRGLVATSLIGHTLFADSERYRWLGSKPLRYLAEVSYALYVIHPLTLHGWLGQGDVIVRYTKRVVCFAITFAAAHVSTFYFEQRFIDWGKALCKRIEQRPATRVPALDEAA